MLKPRDYDVPALFLVLVVLPVVAYILLGRWSESSKRKDRISLMARLAAEESVRAERVVSASVMPVISPPKATLHECARCHAPATTRCSRCKSVRYCSGKCQIIHWRHIHKDECQPLGSNNSSSTLASAGQPTHEQLLYCENVSRQYTNGHPKQPLHGSIYSGGNDSINADALVSRSSNMTVSSKMLKGGSKSADKRALRKSSRELTEREDRSSSASADGISRSKTHLKPSKEAFSKNKLIDNGSVNSRDDISMMYKLYTDMLSSGQTASRGHPCVGAEAEVDSDYRCQEGRSSYASVDGISGSKTHLKPSKEAVLRNKLKGNDSLNSRDEVSMMYNFYTDMLSSGETVSREQPPHIGKEVELDSDYVCQEDASHSSERETNAFKHVTEDPLSNQKFCKDGIVINGEVAEGNSLPETISNGGNYRQKSALHSNAIKLANSSKSLARSSVKLPDNGNEKKGHTCDEPVARMDNISPAQDANVINKMGFMKLMGLKKSSKVSKKDVSETCADDHKKAKMLFPYEEFMKFFQYEIFDLTPRGLSNCGNSCYANAVLQCLTCTKPLLVYLLKRTHSRSCCVKRWCLICELEQHVATLRDSVGPLSPSRILSQMRSMNCPMGDGSQEDAHEFLRLLVASMQSICLKEVGGEKHVHPSLQETTFIQHTFGGRLRSKVECLKCHHRSERCENIMDLTLEIFGWVESLEDALTQFTSWENLDGENMYKCGSCASYVQARKQLSIDEAPNILTIVLKRFQEGNYGKINKCITFPEMLDMIPFMTGTSDVPPLYMLYAVVVHMDTLNASFSGHYVSYVKDPRGNWLRIDDSEVLQVPMSRVMSEGAYMLFYMRSYPRPSQAIHSQTHASTKYRMSKSSKSKTVEEPSDGVGSSVVYNSHASNDMLRFTPMLSGTYAEFSDATSSSDWSLFTSSDDASFTTESTRDSFSTTDYSDMCNPDPVTSFFNSLYAPPESSSQRTVSCRMFSGSQPLTRFALEEKGYVESYQTYLSNDHFNGSWSSGNDHFNGSWSSGNVREENGYEEYANNHHDFEVYDGNYEHNFSRTPESCCRE